jgi:conjugal transfer pilus assembly protein TraF
VKYFGQKHRIVVRAVSLDHKTLPEWPKYRKDQGQWKKFGLEGSPIPAVILFDSFSKKIIPISFGVIGLDELERRIFSLTNIGQENDY